MTIDNFGKAPDVSTTSTGTATNINYNTDYCLHRLPCGYCTLLGRSCPMQGNTVIEPTWRLPDITCTSTPPTASFTEIKG